MIKQLFSTAALLVPGLAYGGNSSADLSVQVVPSPTRACSPSGPGADACEAPPRQAKTQKVIGGFSVEPNQSIFSRDRGTGDRG
jgi:hypothetical protein